MRIMASAVGLICCLSLPASGEPSERQSVVIGPWSISTTYHAEKFISCAMSRSAPDLEITFVRNQDGLLLTLDSPKWTLERGKAYTVRLAAGAQTVEAKALAERKGVTIAFADGRFNERLKTANTLEVKGEGATLRVPLDKSALGFERLELCFGKNSRESTETNPFVAPSRKP
jgi:hypothetical protein